MNNIEHLLAENDVMASRFTNIVNVVQDVEVTKVLHIAISEDNNFVYIK